MTDTDDTTEIEATQQDTLFDKFDQAAEELADAATAKLAAGNSLTSLSQRQQTQIATRLHFALQAYNKARVAWLVGEPLE